MTKAIQALTAVFIIAFISVTTINAKPGPSGTKKKCYKIVCDDGAICFYFVTGQNMEIGVPGRASVTLVDCDGGAHGIVNPVPTTAIFAITSTTGGGIGWTNCDAIVDQTNNQSFVTEFYESTPFTDLSTWQAAH